MVELDMIEAKLAELDGRADVGDIDVENEVAK